MVRLKSLKFIDRDGQKLYILVRHLRSIQFELNGFYIGLDVRFNTYPIGFEGRYFYLNESSDNLKVFNWLSVNNTCLGIYEIEEKCSATHRSTCFRFQRDFFKNP